MSEQPKFSNDEYRRYLKRLAALVYSELVPKVALLDYFTVHAHEFSPQPIKVEPLLWIINSGLYHDTTLSLFRLVHPTQSDRNIVHFLRITKDRYKQIEWEKPFKRNEVVEHLKQWEEQSEPIRRLVTRRNKFFAHYDKEYFYEPDRLAEEVPFGIEDAMEVVRRLQEIVGFYHDRLFGTYPISMEGFVYAGAYRLYELMRNDHAKRAQSEPDQA